MVYSVYHEHFEISTWDGLAKVTCVCGKDFIWTTEDLYPTKPHRCPNCGERWSLGRVGNDVILSRVKTGAKIVLHLTEEQYTNLFSLLDRDMIRT